MKFIRILFILIFASTWLNTSLARDKVLITNGEWPPYLSESLPHYGIASRIVTEAFAKEGIMVEYEFFPWARALILASTANYDGTAVWLKNEEREKNFYLSDPVFYSGYVFFHLKSTKFDWNSIEDLKDFEIGATLEYDYGDEFQKAEKENRIHVTRVPKDENNFSKLLAGRIQIFPSSREVGLSMIKLNFTPVEIEKFTYHTKPLRHDPMHLMLTRTNPNNEKRIKQFNKGLKKLKSSGLVEKYLLEAGK